MGSNELIVLAKNTCVVMKLITWPNIQTPHALSPFIWLVKMGRGKIPAAHPLKTRQ